MHREETASSPARRSTTDAIHHGNLRSVETQIAPLSYTLTEAHLTQNHIDVRAAASGIGSYVLAGTHDVSRMASPK